MKYQKKPITVDAFQLSSQDWPAWFKLDIEHGNTKVNIDGSADVNTLEGVYHARPTDYIIRGVRHEIYACRADIFEETYTRID